MAVDSLFKLFIFLFIKGNLLAEGVLILSHQMLRLHESILLHLINLQLLQWNIHSFSLELSSQELVLLLQFIDDSPLEDLIRPLVFRLELEIMVLEDNTCLVIWDLFVDILHFLMGWHLHLLYNAVLIVFVFLLCWF